MHSVNLARFFHQTNLTVDRKMMLILYEGRLLSLSKAYCLALQFKDIGLCGFFGQRLLPSLPILGN